MSMKKSCNFITFLTTMEKIKIKYHQEYRKDDSNQQWFVNCSRQWLWLGIEVSVLHKWLRGSVTQIAELKPNDLTMVLTLSAKVLEVIFLPGTWNGFETASTYAAWNLLKNWIQIWTRVRCHVKEFSMSHECTGRTKKLAKLNFLFQKSIVYERGIN